ncbi:hypothetical protein HD806DRAFT_111028 [Xylariaceae sp. AK1471]|nr:hypothetical protein HD806DRAFT_111028 [Xylariaceae sp. AK1471]
MLGYSSSKRQHDDAALYSETTARRSLSPLELAPIDTRRPKGRKPKAHKESARPQKSLLETPAVPRLRTPESPEHIRLSNSQRPREKTVRFSGDLYLEAGSSDRLAGLVGQQRDTLRGQSEDCLVRAPGNGNGSGEFRHYAGYNKTLPKRSRAGERQRSYVPATPVIPRLPTPDFDSTSSSYELGLTKYDFCACCIPDDRGEEEDVRWKIRKAKMDKQGMSYSTRAVG